MISFDEGICRQLDQSEHHEWLETNGLGGFSSSTMSGMNTRRYHGLLVAAVRPPTDRFVLLSKFEETLILDGERYELSTNRYPNNTIHPQGFQMQTGFRLDPFPVFSFRAGAVEFEKTIFMLHGENTTVVRYKLKALSKTRATLELRPLIAFRNYHWLGHESADAFAPVEVEQGILSLKKRDDATTLYLAHDAKEVYVESIWYKQFELSVEQARGFDFHEDLFNPCRLVFELTDGGTCNVIASTERRSAREAATFEKNERARRKNLIEVVKDKDEYVQALVRAADQFIVSRGQNLHSVIAGYHWFTDWGRDTMISLPGLALTLKHDVIAREILLAFTPYINQGLIPNRFPDSGEQPEYNTVDGTLWFVHSIGELFKRTGDLEFIRTHLYGALKEIISWHERGTHYGIRMEADGLLRAGEEGIQLTWMDAKVADYVVTPRTGKAVEIQALWYHALRTVEEIAKHLGDEKTRTHCRAVAEGTRASFNGQFWNEADNCLFDYINDSGEPDAAIRPNQIFAVSLPHAILTGERAKCVVETVERELLTPYGLRSLSPRDPEYRPHYEGDPYSRDTAYHQGTVWAWLIGPFINAYLKVNERTPEVLNCARTFTQAFRAHLYEAGVGQVSEIFDAEPPHTPRGCIAQAWSVAELLRCELEELTANKS